MENIEKKEWDSDFFGILVGSIKLDQIQKLRKIDLLSLGVNRFDLVYLLSSTPIRTEANLFSDCKIEFKCAIEQAPEKSDSAILPYDGESDFDMLLSLAWQSGAYSRFKLDTNFEAGKFEQLYKEWLSKSIDKQLADEIFVFRDNNGKLIGFITVAFKDFYCEIGLLAVDLSARGMGVGKKLIAASRAYAYEKGKREIRVATQECNLEAVRFYKSCGFEFFRSTNIYHLWTKNSYDTI